MVTHIHTHPFNGPFSGTTQVSQYQKGKTNLDLTEARNSDRQWHQLGHMQVCTLLQTDNHTSTSPLTFLQAGCPSCRPTNSVTALKDKCQMLLVKWLLSPYFRADVRALVDDKGIKDCWKEYMEKLMNEENEWDHKISAAVSYTHLTLPTKRIV